MTDQPYVEMIIDASSLSYTDELVHRSSETDDRPGALEDAMRATLKPYLPNEEHSGLHSWRLQVVAVMPVVGEWRKDPMARFKTDLAKLQDHRIVALNTRSERARFCKKKLEELTKDPKCLFVLLVTASSASALGFESNSKVKRVDYLPGYIPVNAANQRIDATIIPRPPYTFRNEYEAHVESNDGVNSCNSFHLGHRCMSVPCQFDHGHITENMRIWLRYMCQSKPCGYGDSCRQIDCYLGHFCRREGCNRTDPACKYEGRTHPFDKEIHHWEMAWTDRYRSDKVGYGRITRWI